ncbi:unnamed protein product [Aphanomyces euteiches]
MKGDAEAGSCVVEHAIEKLQDEFEDVLEENEFLHAIDVLMDSTKAKIFMKLKGPIREAWLRRQISNSI